MRNDLQYNDLVNEKINCWAVFFDFSIIKYLFDLFGIDDTHIKEKNKVIANENGETKLKNFKLIKPQTTTFISSAISTLAQVGWWS